MRVINVLTVEDELPMREELESYPWEEWGCIHVASCSNGKEALEFCRVYTVDLVLSDITMPVLDGLSLAKVLHDKYPAVSFILLTCHDDFSYAKKALQLQAVDYILKIDLCHELLKDSIDKIRLKLSKQQTLEQGIRHQKRYAITKLFASCSHDFSNLPAGLVMEYQKLDSHIFDGGYGCFLIVSGSSRHWLFLQEEISAFFLETQGVLDWFVLNTGVFYLALNSRGPKHLEAFTSSLNDYLTRRAYLSIRESSIFLYVIPEEAPDIMSVFHHAGRIDQLRHFHYYYPKKTVIDRRDLTVSFYRLSQEITASFHGLRLSADMEPSDFRQQCGNWAQDKLLYPEDLKSLFVNWLQTFYNNISPNWNLSKLLMADTLEESLDHFCFLLHMRTEHHLRLELKQTLDLIRTRYGSSLSLSYVAEQVGLSTPYLSKIFNQEIGESFSEYLTRIRMEQADKLITGTSKKIYEVAELVGIPNYRYFSKLYKQWKEEQRTS